MRVGLVSSKFVMLVMLVMLVRNQSKVQGGALEKFLAVSKDLLHFPAFWKGLKMNFGLEFRAFYR